MRLPPLVGGILAISLVLLGISWWLAVMVFPANDPAAILHYSYELGIDFVGQGKQIIALPIIGTVLLIFNIGIGILLYRADQRAAWVIWLVIPLIELIIVGSLWLLWQANI